MDISGTKSTTTDLQYIFFNFTIVVHIKWFQIRFTEFQSRSSTGDYGGPKIVVLQV